MYLHLLETFMQKQAVSTTYTVRNLKTRNVKTITIKATTLSVFATQ